MRLNVPQAMSPSHRKLLRESSLGTDGQVMARSPTSTGCYVRDALSTVHDDGPGHTQSASADWGSLKEMFLEQDIGDVRRSELAGLMSRSVVVITDSLKLQAAKDLLGDLTDVASGWKVSVGKAYVFLEKSLREGIAGQVGENSRQDSLRLLEKAAANGFNVVWSDSMEMSKRLDLPRIADALEWLLPTGACVIRGTITTDQADVAIADILETDVNHRTLADVVQYCRSDVHSSRVDAEGRSEGIVACEVGVFLTYGESSRPPYRDCFLSGDPALLSASSTSLPHHSVKVPSNKQMQLAEGLYTAVSEHSSQSKLEPLPPVRFRVPDSELGACSSVRLGEPSMVFRSDQGKDGVSTELSSFGSGMGCQGPAAHIESIDQTSVIADFPLYALQKHQLGASSYVALGLMDSAGNQDPKREAKPTEVWDDRLGGNQCGLTSQENISDDLLSQSRACVLIAQDPGLMPEPSSPSPHPIETTTAAKSAGELGANLSRTLWFRPEPDRMTAAPGSDSELSVKSCRTLGFSHQSLSIAPCRLGHQDLRVGNAPSSPVLSSDTSVQKSLEEHHVLEGRGIRGTCNKGGMTEWLSFTGCVDSASRPSHIRDPALLHDHSDFNVVGPLDSLSMGGPSNESRLSELCVVGTGKAALVKAASVLRPTSGANSVMPSSSDMVSVDGRGISRMQREFHPDVALEDGWVTMSAAITSSTAVPGFSVMDPGYASQGLSRSGEGLGSSLQGSKAFGLSEDTQQVSAPQSTPNRCNSCAGIDQARLCEATGAVSSRREAIPGGPRAFEGFQSKRCYLPEWVKESMQRADAAQMHEEQGSRQLSPEEAKFWTLRPLRDSGYLSPHKVSRSSDEEYAFRDMSVPGGHVDEQAGKTSVSISSDDHSQMQSLGFEPQVVPGGSTASFPSPPTRVVLPSSLLRRSSYLPSWVNQQLHKTTSCLEELTHPSFLNNASGPSRDTEDRSVSGGGDDLG